MKNKMKMNNKGFSLVELIVVIAIMAILVGVLAPSVMGQLDKAKVAKDKQTLDSIATAVAIAWADPETPSKPTVSGTSVTDITSATGISYGTQFVATSTAGTTFKDVCMQTVGYTTITFESNAFNVTGVGMKVEVNPVSGKVTVTATGTTDPKTSQPYCVTK